MMDVQRPERPESYKGSDEENWAQSLEEAPPYPRDWTRLGFCIAFQPFSWNFGIDRGAYWRTVAVDLGPVRISVQWP